MCTMQIKFVLAEMWINLTLTRKEEVGSEASGIRGVNRGHKRQVWVAGEDQAKVAGGGGGPQCGAGAVECIQRHVGQEAEEL